MFDRAAAGAVSALKSALLVVVLFFVLIGVAKWAKTNPEGFDRAVSAMGSAAVSVVVWVCDGITSLLGGTPPA